MELMEQNAKARHAHTTKLTKTVFCFQFKKKSYTFSVNSIFRLIAHFLSALLMALAELRVRTVSVLPHSTPN